jgi:phage recombination protein Bet
MNNQIEKTQSTISFSKEQLELIKTQIAPEATNDELQLFLYTAKRSGLDPLARQIYCIHRSVKLPNGQYGKKMTVQTSIDGFRVIAERSGLYGGQGEPIFDYNPEGDPISCKISVFKFRGDVRYEAAVGVAFFSEYAQTDRNGNLTGLWASKKRIMLQKVAESLALRKAFAQDLSGLYISEEMPPAEETVVTASYIKSHDNQEDLELAIDSCETTKELKSLYDLNEAIVKDLEMGPLFTERRKKLK